MLGLIKKDLLIAKHNLKVMIIIIIAYSFIAINGDGDFSFIPAFLSVMIMISTFSYDEYNKADAFIVTLPNGKKNAVKAKYLSTILIAIMALIFTFILSVLTNCKHINIEEIMTSTIGCAFAIFLIQSIMYPTIYKFGVEKSRITLFVFVFGTIGITSLLAKSNINIKVPDGLITILSNYYVAIIPILTVLMLLISYKISEHIYLKKEF